MSTNQPLTVTVEQAAEVLGVGRSTAYELVRSGDLKCIRLRRRIVVPVAHLAESLGVDHDAVWAALTDTAVESPRQSIPKMRPPAVEPSDAASARRRPRRAAMAPTLF